MSDPMTWVKSHPYETGGIVFLVGVAALYVLGFFSSGSQQTAQSSGSDDVAAYLSAESAQAQAGDELQAVQDQDQASTAQTLINAQASVANNSTWATAQTTETASNNATTVSTTTLNDLTALAAQPTVTTGNSLYNSDFGTITNVSTSTNPVAQTAGGLLGEYVNTSGNLVMN